MIKKHRSRWLSATLLCVVGLLVGIGLGLCGGIAWVSANHDAWGAYLRRFALSPGPAALAALFAAVVAVFSIRTSSAASRGTLEHQKATANADAWWEMFEWVSDRAAPADAADRPLPTAVTVRTLERLADIATSEPQRAACSGMIDLLADEFAAEQARRAAPNPSEDDDKTGGTEPTATRQTEQETESEMTADAALLALASYAAANEGRASASARAEGLAYFNEVNKALLSLSWDHKDVKLFRNPSGAGSADAILQFNGRQIAVSIKRTSSVEATTAWIRRERATARSGKPRLLISTTAPASSPSEERESRLVVVQWRTPYDNDNVLKAARRASLL